MTQDCWQIPSIFRNLLKGFLSSQKSHFTSISPANRASRYISKPHTQKKIQFLLPTRFTMRTGWLALHYPLYILFNSNLRQYLNDALVILDVPKMFPHYLLKTFSGGYKALLFGSSVTVNLVCVLVSVSLISTSF